MQWRFIGLRRSTIIGAQRRCNTGTVVRDAAHDRAYGPTSDQGRNHGQR